MINPNLVYSQIVNRQYELPCARPRFVKSGEATIEYCRNDTPDSLTMYQQRITAESCICEKPASSRASDQSRKSNHHDKIAKCSHMVRKRMSEQPCACILFVVVSKGAQLYGMDQASLWKPTNGMSTCF